MIRKFVIEGVYQPIENTDGDWVHVDDIKNLPTFEIDCPDCNKVVSCCNCKRSFLCVEKYTGNICDKWESECSKCNGTRKIKVVELKDNP